MSPSGTNGLHQAPRTASSGEDREQLLRQAAQYHQQGRLAAEAGDLTTAARSILQGLDCERRAGGLGPQVLQLIKPR